MTEFLNWHEVHAYLTRKLEAARVAVERAEDMRVIAVQQGRIQVLRELLQLPHLLAHEKQMDQLAREAKG